ncbi:MAG: hypothetical protein ACI4T5_08415 [Prevotella sp.]
MMIKHLNEKYVDLVESVFLKIPFPERFNDHNLGVKSISFAETSKNQLNNIKEFVSEVNIGQKMVAKWFNFNRQTNSFNMELIKQRGFYSANVGDRQVARVSIRGKAMLEDAGENLIKNTYLLVNDISYQSKGSGNWILKSYAAAYTGNVNNMQKALQGVGGFEVTIKSYLFRLKWNDEIAMEFYTKYYTEDGINDKDKIGAFKADKGLFTMEFVGETSSVIKEKEFKTLKNPETFLMKVTKRTIDHNIAQLQHQFEDFRIKAPLLSTNPLKADVGLKEDVREDSQFEVLERMMDENGRVSYERVGIIRPVKGKIKDNRYLAEEDTDTILDATEFEVVSGKNFVPGMLIREK